MMPQQQGPWMNNAFGPPGPMMQQPGLQSFSPQSWMPMGQGGPGMGPPMYAQSADFGQPPMGQYNGPMAPGNFGGNYFQPQSFQPNMEPVMLPKFDVPAGGIPGMMGPPFMQGPSQGNYGAPYQPNTFMPMNGLGGMGMGGPPMGNMPMSGFPNGAMPFGDPGFGPPGGNMNQMPMFTGYPMQPQMYGGGNPGFM